MQDEILSIIPEHFIYVELVSIKQSLLFSKSLSPVETFNDKESEIVNFFRVLRDKDKFEEFSKVIYDREPSGNEEINKAYNLYLYAKENLNTKIKYRFSFPNDMYDYLSRVELLPEICQRLLVVQIDYRDDSRIIKTYDTENTLFLANQDLLENLENIKGQAIVYCDSDYNPVGWEHIKIDNKTILIRRNKWEHHLYTTVENHI